MDKVGLLCISRLFGLLQRCTRGLFKVYKPAQITVLLVIFVDLVVDNLSPEIQKVPCGLAVDCLGISSCWEVLLEFLENS